MRYVSVLDCAMVLTNEVYECGLDRRKCSIENLRKKRVACEVIALLNELRDDQGDLREERNARFHQGVERSFTKDDLVFRIAARFKLRGTYEDGRRINVQRTFREGLVDLQRLFNPVSRRLVRQLDRLYDVLGMEFEARFSPKFKVGFGGRQQSGRAGSP